MDTETMIRELKRIEEKHKYDKVFTGQVNIAEMAHDVGKRLEELKPYEDTGLTPEQIAELKKRDTVEMTIITGDNHAIGCKVGTCPKCDAILMSYMGFCHECGQRLDWEEL